jgi:hypothetical protein
MFKADANEAMPIIRHAMDGLLLTIDDSGRSGSDARTAIGDMLAHMEVLLRDDMIGAPLANCFDLARKAGATMSGIATIYSGVVSEAPVTLGGNLIRDSLLKFCFATIGRIVVEIDFTSREAVDEVRQAVSSEFVILEEIVADAMDSESYTSLVRMNAAVMRFLIETARPLPRMLAFRFAAPLPTLIAAHRLYDDASRCDELREENKVVHPMFMRPEGRALSA